jgi:hypothetical protein
MRQVTIKADIPGDGGKYNTAPVVLDQYLTPFQVSYLSSNGGQVEVTFTDPYPVVDQNFVEAEYDWMNADTSYPNAGNFLGQPVRAVRLTGVDLGTTLTVVQSGDK